MEILLGVGGPLLIAVVWGTFISSKATVKVPRIAWLGLLAFVFGSAAVALAAVASPAMATTFVLVVVSNVAVMGAFGW